METAIIFTDDSDVKLPRINKWKHTLGKGKRIQNHEAILETLHGLDLPIPSTNLELEQVYCNALREYIRPTQLMLAGMFTEVRSFHKELEMVAPTQLFIVSGRYGLIREDKEIIPYSAPVKTLDDLTRLDKRTEFVKRMRSVSRNKKFIIMFFPLLYHDFLLERRWFAGVKDDQMLIVVGGSGIRYRMSSARGFRWMARRGVARIGKKNRALIKNIITLAIEDDESQVNQVN